MLWPREQSGNCNQWNVLGWKLGLKVGVHWEPGVSSVASGRGPPHLCLQGTSGLSQSGFDGGHQLQKPALHVHVAITSLLGVNQLPCYECFKEAGDLESPLAANVQTSREPIF